MTAGVSVPPIDPRGVPTYCPQSEPQCEFREAWACEIDVQHMIKVFASELGIAPA